MEIDPIRYMISVRGRDGLGASVMPKPRKDQDEKDLEKLAKKLLSMPHKPREESKIGKREQKRPARNKPKRCA